MKDEKDTAPARSGAPSSRIPLCVDLDGTLVRTDLLWESVFALARRNPFRLFRLPFWLAAGRARLKERIAAEVCLDPAALPYNREVVEYLERAKAEGRRLVLVTASHASPARAVADHLGLFDEVIATDGERNLKGREKRLELIDRFGEGGFDYAGDSRADLAVWPAAREAIVVNPSPRLLRRFGERPRLVLESPRRPFPALLLAAIRVRQWVKNSLVFLPVLLAHRYLDPDLLTDAATAFVAFSLGSSAVYVLNDLLDVDADRAHPQKCRRPFASGQLPLCAGLLLFPVLVAASLGAASLLPGRFVAVLLFYFVTTTLYSLYLKQMALVDILVLASLYTTRIIAGSVATGIVVSEWLLAFSMFIFLSLGAVKRYGEVARIRAGESEVTKIKRRGYFAGDLELIVQMGLTSGYIAVLVLALFITSDDVTTFYRRPSLLWLVCPLALFWISRIWLLAHRGHVQDDPLMFSVRDRTTWVVVLLSVGIVLAASRGF